MRVFGKLLLFVLAFCGLLGSYSSLAVDYDALIIADKPVLFLKMNTPEKNLEKDYSSIGLQGSYQGKPAATTMPNGDGATVFNGLDQYLEVGSWPLLSVNTTGVLTLEAWMRPDVLEFPRQEGSGYVHWMGKGTAGQQEYAARIYSRTDKRLNRISGYAFNLAGGLGSGSYVEEPVKAGEWIHYVLVINTNVITAQFPTGYTALYKNGILKDRKPLKKFNVVPQAGAAPFRVGTRDKASFFKGAIGKVAVYDYELSPEKILAHYRGMEP